MTGGHWQKVAISVGSLESISKAWVGCVGVFLGYGFYGLVVPLGFECPFREPFSVSGM